MVAKKNQTKELKQKLKRKPSLPFLLLSHGRLLAKPNSRHISHNQ